MRGRRGRGALFLSAAAPMLVVLATLTSGAGGCSSDAVVTAGGDASVGPGQALGTPCDPALLSACEPVTDVCSVTLCDPTTRRCIRVPVEAGPICGDGVPPCTSGACDGGGEAGDAEIDAPSLAPSDGGDAASDGAIDAGSSDATSDAALDAAVDGGAIDAGSDASDAEAASDVGGE
jgi:hypothetical protein